MNRYRTIPGLSGQQKASATTVCQKCLKKDMFYECKAGAQERPYKSRPSRTQQLSNPKLVPKLASDMPNALLQSKGVADEQLAKAEKERGSSLTEDFISPNGSPSQPRKRSRSVSSNSSRSVSTISTNKSRSISPKRIRRKDPDEMVTSRPDVSMDSRGPSKDRKRRRTSSSSQSPSVSSREQGNDRNHRRRHRVVSPHNRGRPNSERRGSHRSRSRSVSMDKSRVARGRVSFDSANGSKHEGNLDVDRGERPPIRSNDRDGRRVESAQFGRNDGRARPRKDRSLSPYSRRLALTQAMNMR